MHGAAVKENIENQFLRKAPSKTILEKKNKKIVLKKQKQKKGTSKNQLNPVGAAVSEARIAKAGIYILEHTGIYITAFSLHLEFFVSIRPALYKHLIFSTVSQCNLANESANDC